MYEQNKKKKNRHTVKKNFDSHLVNTTQQTFYFKQILHRIRLCL